MQITGVAMPKIQAGAAHKVQATGRFRIAAAENQQQVAGIELQQTGLQTATVATETGSQSTDPAAVIEIVPVAAIISTLATTIISMSMHGVIQW